MSTVGAGSEVRYSVVMEDQQVSIPAWVKDLKSFRRWVGTDEVPEDGRICYLKGEVWVDMSWEQVFSHNQVKGEFTLSLMGLVKKERRGRYFPDGLRLTSMAADFSVVPDGTFVSAKSLRKKRVHLVEGAKEGYIELEGIPDMVLEVISDSSVRKDTKRLRELYAEAGIPEYWLVDARGERLVFEILRHTAKGYVATRKQGGWLKSAMFGKSFRLTQQTDENSLPEYTLAVR
jgi:Uma2 family endonuclease